LKYLKTFATPKKRIRTSRSVEVILSASLGQGLYKVRLKITSKGKGKSGGARVITCVKIIETKIILAAIYDKSEQETITPKELSKLINKIQ
jgi:hypothetical protein